MTVVLTTRINFVKDSAMFSPQDPLGYNLFDKTDDVLPAAGRKRKNLVTESIY